MAHATTQFGMSHIDAQSLTVERERVQRTQMWEAVDFTLTLDRLVDERSVQYYIDNYLRTFPYAVARRVFENYVDSRGMKMWPFSPHRLLA